MKKYIFLFLLLSSISIGAFLPQTEIISQSGNRADVTASSALKTDSSATTQPVSLSSSPLPSGASTADKQDIGNASLSSLDGKIPASPSQEHVTAGSPNATRLSDGTSFYVGFKSGDSIGNTAFTANAGTNLNTSALSLEATQLSFKAANHTDLLGINTTLGSPFQAGGSIGNTAFGISGTLPAYAATPTFNVGTTGGITLDSTLSALSAKFGSLGQKTMAGSAPVVIASDQSAIPTTVSSLPLPSNAAQETGGHLASIDTKLTSPLAVTGTFFQATQPISAAALPLPAGASTSALQTTGNTSLASIDGKIPASPSQEHTTAGSPSSVRLTDGTSFYKGTTPADTQPVSGTVTANAGTGTFTVSGTVTSNQGTSPWVTNVSQFGGSVVATGTGVSGSGVPRVTVANDSNILATQSGAWSVGITNATLASSVYQVQINTTLAMLTQPQASITVGQNGPLVQGSVTTDAPGYSTGQTDPLSLNRRGGLRIVDTGQDTSQIIRNDYSSTNVTTATYVQLVASTSTNINKLWISDTSGQDFVLATGAAASEVDQIQIPPGGWDSPVSLFIPSGTRISIKSKSATASSGILNITGLK